MKTCIFLTFHALCLKPPGSPHWYLEWNHWPTVSSLFFCPASLSHLSTSWLTPSLAQCSSSLEAPSPVLLTCFPGAAAAAQGFTRRATGGRCPPRTCQAWRGCWKPGPWLSYLRASLPPPDLKDHSTPMNPYCPSWWGPAWACGGSATSGGLSMHR